MFGFLTHKSEGQSELLTSKLYDESTFYPALMKDLENCGSELVIECPFITNRRLHQLLPVFQKLNERKVRIVINTRNPREHDEERWRDEAYRAIAMLQCIGIHILYTVGNHHKLVIIDRTILYEGSLNALSQNGSTEIMRRVESIQLAWQMMRFVGIDRLL